MDITHSDIVRHAGRPDDVAQSLGVSVHTVRSWIRRNSLPAEHWAKFEREGWATTRQLAAAADVHRAA
jgi:uncharacterized protein YjcR